MTNSKKVTLPKVEFDSNLTGLIVELERVREKYNRGTTPASLFFELKDMFQLFTSIISARIEGNHTTVIDVLDALNEASDSGIAIPDSVQEIENIQKGIDFIEEHIHSMPIDKEFILQLHRIVVEGLVREGDLRAGAYRVTPITISKSKHVPPMPSDVDEHMSELIIFINENHGTQYDLLKDAIVHHRFVWIHPFGNGNGRVARLLTYAMMAKQGFIDSTGIRTLNPTAVFGSNREEFYDYLQKADSLKDGDVLQWAEYMLGGVQADLISVGKLQDADFVRTKIILPALKAAQEAGRITEQQHQMLLVIARNDTVKAADFNKIISGSHVLRSQAIKKLRDARLIRTKSGSDRLYTLRLSPNTITRYIRKQLDDNGLLPTALKD
jgi:Fic family protein